MRTGSVVPKNIVFYEEKKITSWHRFADIFIPLVTLLIFVLIGLYLYNYLVDPRQMEESSKWKVFALSGVLMGVSFAVFCYLYIRLNLSILGKRKFVAKFSFLRRSQSNNFLTRSSSDLQYCTVPFNSHLPTYESIPLNVPSSYTFDSKKCQPSGHNSNASSLKIEEV